LIARDLCDKQFLNWFWSVVRTIRFKKHIFKLWSQGLIFHFLPKETCEVILSKYEPGTFLIRFSESQAGLLAVAYVSDEKLPTPNVTKPPQTPLSMNAPMTPNMMPPPLNPGLNPMLRTQPPPPVKMMNHPPPTTIIPPSTAKPNEFLVPPPAPRGAFGMPPLQPNMMFPSGGFPAPPHFQPPLNPLIQQHMLSPQSNLISPTGGIPFQTPSLSSPSDSNNGNGNSYFIKHYLVKTTETGTLPDFFKQPQCVPLKTILKISLDAKITKVAKDVALKPFYSVQASSLSKAPGYIESMIS